MSAPGERDGVLVLGGGQAGFQTVASLRERGYSGPVTLVADDDRLPYQRPPLSKAYLDAPMTMTQLAFRPSDYFDRHAIVRRRGRATQLDRSRRVAVLDDGEQISYDHVVIATGCRPRRLDVPGDQLDGVHHLKDLVDAECLTAGLARCQRLVVVGAGFIGLEVAAAARKRGLDVTVLEVTDRAMGRAVSHAMGDYFIGQHRDAGTRIRLGTGVDALIDDGSGRVAGVLTTHGDEVPADLVVVGVGANPNTELAEHAGLRVDGGVVVDELLVSVDDPAVSAVGDCCRFVEARTGAPVRLESVQNAVEQARCVAGRIAGAPAPYTAVPWFWTEQLGRKLQIAGLTAGHDHTEVVGSMDGRAFSVLCFAGERLLGVESVNSPADHLAARRLLAAGGAALDAVTPSLARTSGFSLRQAAP